MSNDPFLDLRRELLDAHRRERRRTRLPRLPSPGTLATAAVVIASLALCAGFIVLLGGGAGSHDRDRALRRAPPAARTFRDVVGLFRRPQTAADRPHDAVQLMHGALKSQAIPSTLRLGASAPWGRVFYVLIHYTPHAHPDQTRETIAAMLFGSGGGGVGVSLDGVARFLRRGSGSLIGGRPPMQGLLVPDGVSRVIIHYPRQRGRGSPVYAQAITQVVAIHDNAALIRLPVHRRGDRRTPDWIQWDGPQRYRRIVSYRATIPGGTGKVLTVP